MKKSVDFFFDNQIDGGITKVTDGDMVFWNQLHPATGGNVQQSPPPPGCCCAESPSGVLKAVSADFLAFYDKWYGSTGRTVVDGFYVWSNASCPPPAQLKVPTDSYLDQISDSNSLCADPPLIFDAFNSMRDAAVHMGQLIVVKPIVVPSQPPCPQVVACPQFDVFDVRFTPTRSCDDPLQCNFDGFPDSQRTAGTRVQKCERLCMFHYLELQTIVDDMMTNGVVEIDYGGVGGISVESGGMCSPTLGNSCVHSVTDIYTDTAKSSCYRLSNGFCMGENASVTGFHYKSANAWHSCVVPQEGCDPCFIGVYNDVCPFDITGHDYTGWNAQQTLELTQNGASQLDKSSCTNASFDVPIHYHKEEIFWGLKIDGTCGVVSSTIQDFDTITQIGNLATPGVWWRSSFVGENICNDGNPTFFDWIGDETGPVLGVGVDCCDPGDGALLCGDCNKINGTGASVAVTGDRLFALSVSPDDADCSGENTDCKCNECSCPGIFDHTNTKDQLAPIGFDPFDSWIIGGPCGHGQHQNVSVSAKFKYSRSCPDSGLTGIKMLDSRISPINGSVYTETELTVASLPHPGCPGSISQSCSGFKCLRGYGELA